MTARDRLSDVPVRARLAANRVRTGASNAWYRAAGRRISGTRQGISNARSSRAIERGRRDLPARASAGLRSSLPVVRNRIDRSTGRQNRDARVMGRLSDQSLARMAPARRAGRGRSSR